jgi:putative transposase
MIEPGHQELSIVKQCSLLGLNRSSFYYAPVRESDENLQILRCLDEQYLKTPFWGARKLIRELAKQGYKLNMKRLRRLMSIQGWRTLYPQPRTSVSDPAKYKYPYLLKDLKIERRNQVWEIDITYVPMQKGFMYLCAIIDVHTRYVVGWGLSNSMTAEWVVGIICEAILLHGRPEILNSDQGSQFTSELYVSLLIKEEISISMDGKGRAIDNIFVERLWRSVKYEHIYLYAYEDGLSLYQGLYRYFEFYNHVRMHQSLGYETPASRYLRNDVRESSGMPCGQLARFSQRLTVTAHAPEGEPLKKSRPTSENHLKFNELLS